MRKSAISYLMILSVLFFCSSFTYAVIDYDSGNTEVLDVGNILVRVDYNVDNVPGTHLLINQWHYISALNVFHHGQATITNGKIIQLAAFDYGHITIAGGDCSDGIYVYNNSLITYVGSNFKVGGVPVSGYMNIDYLVSVGALEHYTASDGTHKYTGVLTGTLADGTVLAGNRFFLRYELVNGVLQDGGNYNFIPEPATMLLLSAGGLLLRRRK